MLNIYKLKQSLKSNLSYAAVVGRGNFFFNFWPKIEKSLGQIFDFWSKIKKKTRPRNLRAYYKLF